MATDIDIDSVTTMLGRGRDQEVSGLPHEAVDRARVAAGLSADELNGLAASSEFRQAREDWDAANHDWMRANARYMSLGSGVSDEQREMFSEQYDRAYDRFVESEARLHEAAFDATGNPQVGERFSRFAGEVELALRDHQSPQHTSSIDAGAVMDLLGRGRDQEVSGLPHEAVDRARVAAGLSADELNGLAASSEFRQAREDWDAANHDWMRANARYMSLGSGVSDEQREMFSEQYDRAYDRFVESEARLHEAAFDATGNPQVGERFSRFAGEVELALRDHQSPQQKASKEKVLTPALGAPRVGPAPATSVLSLGGAPRVGGHVQGRSHEQVPSMDR